jgi:hypothetical protein
MNQDRPEIKELSNDFAFTGGGKSYIPVPVKKLLQFNIVDVKTTEQIDNFKTKPDGSDNPNYGKSVDMYIVEFELNDPSTPDANGQVYTKWVTTSVSDKSNLGKISDAVFGSPTAILEHKKGDLVGAPVQAALAPGKKNPERLVIDVDKIMPPLDGQKRLEVKTGDVVPTEVPEDLGAAFDRALEEAR